MSEQVHASGPMYRPSHDDDPGMDRKTMKLLAIMGGGGVAILAAIALYSLTGRGGGELPVVQADNRPLRERPLVAGGMAVSPEEKPAAGGEGKLAPGTEEPNPKALMAIPGASKPAVPSAVPAKTFAVQLSTAKSEAEAQAAWDRLVKKMPDVIGQHRPLFRKSNDPGTAPWRLRTGGFTDAAQAKAFCDKVKAKGGQCTMAEL